MIDVLDKDKCTGCAACYNICPTKAIDMVYSTDGFLCPSIDKDKCIKCNLCEKICPILSKKEDFGERYSIPKVKVAWSLDEDIRLNSTSGGIFSELAIKFIENNGFVAGAVYNNSFLVEHYITNKKEDIARLRQSKYVQSDKKNIYFLVKELLENNKQVMFVGAPCEVAGLYCFLQKRYNNLLTVDFICLGASSVKVYKKFLDMLKEKYHGDIKKVWFKNKTQGWNLFSTKVEFTNGKSYLRNRFYDYFMRGYIGKNKFYVRKVCTQCKYKGFPRVADISLGDFWGAWRINHELDDNKGTSAVILNSEAGRIFFDKLDKARIKEENRKIEDVLAGNMALTKCVILDPERKNFFIDLDEMRFDKLIGKYCPYTIKDEIKLLWIMLKRKFNIIKRL
ncbi:Coenzyme F420 hydrogenase/dehydrogenase, beta subunit C-terminal domain [Pectinatus sottacetonis]|uniref:Coenzyme F420 hydrogenase/dehydrogenase, beta subunit C-terminal domain n=1 Tax=Pectinatus sottacetonis TaxID=1002795 RepID=UPI0018C4A694|nr:Coenzyme F420 hydrogenase/dehydrogenase, beta subunit C-terminal domain [Pectinatus sottacetonis]